MKDLYPEFKNTILTFCEDVDMEDFAKFHVLRLCYETPESLVNLYNREVDIGMTGEKIQAYYFVILHRLFLRSFEKSPLVYDYGKKTIKVLGKIRLTHNGFEFLNENRNFLKLV